MKDCSEVGAAVIGLGNWGKIHARAYQLHSDAKLVAVCDADPERATNVGKIFDCDHCWDSQAIADDDRIAVVSIATPDYAHFELALRMLQAGKHVLVEKPLTMNTEEGKLLVRTAKENELLLMTDFHNRWNPPLALAKQQTDNNQFGDPVFLKATLNSTPNTALNVLSWGAQTGPEWFLPPHIVDLVCWFVGEQPCRVFAATQRGVLAAKGLDVFDGIQMQLQFPNCSAFLEASWILPWKSPRRLEFTFDYVGSAGRFNAYPSYNSLEWVDEEKAAAPFFSGLQDIHDYPTGFFLQPIWNFVDTVKKKRTALVRPDDGVLVTYIIEQALASAEEQQAVELTKCFKQ